MERLDLDQDLLAEYDALMVKGDLMAWENKFENEIKSYLQAWAIIPEPKLQYSESYHISIALGRTYVKTSDLKSAKEWSEILFKSALHRIDSGHRDFLAGMVDFELGQFDSAKEYFKTADKKSKGRCWKIKAVKVDKYFLFYKKK